MMILIKLNDESRSGKTEINADKSKHIINTNRETCQNLIKPGNKIIPNYTEVK